MQVRVGLLGAAVGDVTQRLEFYQQVSEERCATAPDDDIVESIPGPKCFVMAQITLTLLMINANVITFVLVTATLTLLSHAHR